MTGELLGKGQRRGRVARSTQRNDSIPALLRPRPTTSYPSPGLEVTMKLLPHGRSIATGALRAMLATS